MRKRADDKADVQALLDNNNWGAICAVLVYRLRPDMPRENQEILSSLRFQLVRWDFIRCEWSRQHHQLLNLKLQTTDLGEALAAARQPKGKDYAIKAVTRIICSYERRALQYHWLKGAKTALVHLRVSLECAGRFNQDGEKKYRAALGRLNAFRTWLGDGPEDKVGEQPRLLAG